jgi:hypothetical protein
MENYTKNRDKDIRCSVVPRYTNALMPIAFGPSFGEPESDLRVMILGM